MSYNCPFLISLFVLLIRFLACAQSNGSVTIYGLPASSDLFEDLRISFILSHDYNLTYQPIPADNTLSYLNLGHAVVVDTLVNVPANSVVIPLFGFPLVIVYNLDSFLSSCSFSCSSSSSLMLTQQALVDIFLGRIVYWNDSALTTVNPNITLPDEPITLIVGAFLDRVVEGMTVLAGVPLSQANMSANTIQADLSVCTSVKALPFSLGFSWMGNAVETNAELALLQNLEGNWATPILGTPIAMSEYNAAQKTASVGVTVYPHNMPGKLAWPLIDIMYVVIPQNMSSCDELIILQHFLSLVLFQTDSINLLAEVLGWQPAKSLLSLDNPLGEIGGQTDYYRDLLFGIPCGTKTEVRDHQIGTSFDLWPFVLKMLAPYTGEVDDSIDLSSSPKTINTFLDSMLLGRDAVEIIDMGFTWVPVVKPYYPRLISVPCFMGSIVTVFNLGSNASFTLSLPLLASIFVGNITQWNHPAIQALNKDVLLPSHPIIVFAAPIQGPDGPSALFESLLIAAVPSFSWSQVNITVAFEKDVFHLLDTPYSIGYGFGHLVDDPKVVPKLIGSNASQPPVEFSRDSLFACWYSFTNESCWPLSIPLAMVALRPNANTSCANQKHTADFIDWVMRRTGGLDQFLPPNLLTVSIGDVEFCDGRSLLRTIPEAQTLNPGLVTATQVLSALGILWAVCQAIALAIARRRSELKSASVVYSLLAVIGVFLILLCPLLIVQSNLTMTKCGSAIWFLVLGFTACWGSLFAKLFRLYTIFTSRKLVVPRLSNRRLFWIVLAFLIMDFVLLLIYNILTPPESGLFSGYIDDPKDLVTGQRHLTLQLCNFHQSPALILLIVIKFLMALCGAVMAYFIRAVDRRFSSTSALGYSFYNLFFSSFIAALILALFKSESDLESALFIPVFCGLWIIFVTLVALTLDSNVLMACQDFSKPLRRLLNPSKDSKEAKESKEKKGSVIDEAEAGQSRSSTIFVVNREMFPSKYDQFENELLAKILEELNFQRSAVRRAMAPNTTGTGTTVNIELVDAQHRGSIGMITPTGMSTPTRFNSKSNSSKVSEVPRPNDAIAHHKVSTEAPDSPIQLVSESSDSQQDSKTADP